MDVAREHFEPFIEALKEKAEVIRSLEDHPHGGLIASEFEGGVEALAELIYSFGPDDEYDSMIEELDNIQQRAADHV